MITFKARAKDGDPEAIVLPDVPPNDELRRMVRIALRSKHMTATAVRDRIDSNYALCGC